MTKAVQFKVHTDEAGKTVDLSLRITVIDNGFVIKAGGPPFHCVDEKALKDALVDMASRFAAQTIRKEDG